MFLVCFIQVLVVIVDRKSSNSPADIKTIADPLEKNGIRVIPVAVGSDADPEELEKTTTSKKNVIKVPKNEKPNRLGQKIMDKILTRKL